MSIITQVKGDGNVITGVQKASTTVTKNTLWVFDANGQVTACTSTSTTADFEILQTQTAASGETPDVSIRLLTGSEFLECDCTNAVAQTQVGNWVDLTDAWTLNNTASDGTYKAVQIVKIIWPTADKKVLAKVAVRPA